MKIQIKTSVTNGKLTRNRNLILDSINSYEGKDLLITFEKPKKQRSNNQNAYYFGVILSILQNCIKESWGEVWSKEKAHDFCKLQFNFIERVNESTGEVVKVPKSTTENTTTAQEEYQAEIRNFIKEWFNVDVPLPNEEITLNFNE